MALDYLQSRLVRRKLVAEIEKGVNPNNVEKPIPGGTGEMKNTAQHIRNYEAEIQQVQIGPNSIGGGGLLPQ